MGLLDSLLGGLGGGVSSKRTAGMTSSPVVKALLLLLAAKAAQSYTSGSSSPKGAEPGGLGDLGRTGDLGGLGSGGLGSGGLGELLSGGLGGLIEQFRGRGFGDQIDSWIGTGENRRLEPGDMGRALGPDTIAELEQQTGMPRDELLSELSREVPDAIDRITPQGRLPVEDELAAIFSKPRR